MSKIQPRTADIMGTDLWPSFDILARPWWVFKVVNSKKIVSWNGKIRLISFGWDGRQSCCKKDRFIIKILSGNRGVKFVKSRLVNK